MRLLKNEAFAGLRRAYQSPTTCGTHDPSVAGALTRAGAELARDQAEVGLDLIGVAEAVGIINGGDEGGGGDGPDAGTVRRRWRRGSCAARCSMAWSE